MNLFDVYPLYPIEPVKGKGSYVYDAEGKEYLDLYGGHAVISIGHAHPHYVGAISQQVGLLGFYSNSVENSLQGRLAELLGKASGSEDYSLFLCNSGAEANENAIKLASFHTGKSKILAFGKAFRYSPFGDRDLDCAFGKSGRYIAFGNSIYLSLARDKIRKE